MEAHDGTARYDGAVPGRKSDPQVSRAFGRVLKTARTDAEMSRLALALAVGLQRADDIGRLERGDREPTLSTFLALARALRIGSAALLSATEEKLR